MPQKLAFAIDVGNGNLTAAFAGEDGEATGVSELVLANIMTGGSPPIEKLIDLLAAKMRAAPRDVDVIMFSMACDLSHDRRTVVNSPGSIWLNGQPLASIIEENLGKPVVMERRANVFLAFDRVALNLPGDATVIGCYIDDFYENAIWCGGGLLRGKSGAAGNIGHMPVHGREDNCYCGKLGCIELYGTGSRLKQLHSLIFPDTAFDDIFTKQKDHPLLQNFIAMLAYPVAVEANILDPDYIVLGGKIPTMPNFPRDEVEEQLRAQTYYPEPSRNLSLLGSVLKETDNLVAAAQYAFVNMPG